MGTFREKHRHKPMPFVLPRAKLPLPIPRCPAGGTTQPKVDLRNQTNQEDFVVSLLPEGTGAGDGGQ